MTGNTGWVTVAIAPPPAMVRLLARPTTVKACSDRISYTICLLLVGPFTVRSPDVPTEAPDAPVAIADGAALPEYAGSYYSQELDTTYTIAVDDRGLYAAHARHEDIRLTSLADDTFAGDEWFFGEARFTRAGGDVDGFLLSVERVRNVRFARRS